MVENLKYLIFSLSLLVTNVFFSVYSLLGIEFGGSESNNLYVNLCILLFVLVFVYAIADMKKMRNKKIYFLPAFLCLIFLFEYSLFSYTNNQNTLLLQNFKCFIAFSVPGMMIGANVSNDKSIERLYPWIDAIAILISFGCLVTLPRFLVNGWVVQYGGSSYQQLSYNAAFAFSVLLYNSISKVKYRFPLLNYALFNYLSYLLMMGCIVCVIFSGGRGGFLLLVVSTALLLYLERKRHGKSFLFLEVIVLLVPIALYLADFGIINMLIDNGLGRISESFFTKDGYSVSKAGRDEVFNLAFNLIEENPLGCGIFRSYALMGNYPHNIFVEILLEGGYTLFIIFICLIVRFARKIYCMASLYKEVKFLLVLFLYPAVMLCFSGTYLWFGLFWFVVTYIFSFKLPNKNSANL